MADRWEEPDSVRDTPQGKWREAVKLSVAVRESNRLQRELEAHPELRALRMLAGPAIVGRAEYLDVPHRGWNDRVRLGRVALTQLRTTRNHLRVRTAAWVRPLGSGNDICQRCGRGADDERHFLVHCSLFAERRAALLLRISRWQHTSRDAHDYSPLWWLDQASEDVQFQVLAGGTLPVHCAAFQRTAILRMLLIELGDWMQIHQEQRARIKRIEAGLDA